MAAPLTHAPKFGKLVFEASSFTCKNSRHERVIDDHCLNYAVSVVMPGYSRVPDIITNPLCEEKSYIIHLPVAEFIKQEFLEAFVKRGKVSLLSHGTWVDTEDCVAFLHTGHLVLNLTKDSYELLGLEGQRSLYGGKKTGKYVVVIDTSQSYFKPGKNFYERVKVCLEKHVPLEMDFLCTWAPTDDKICPSSLVRYFERLGYHSLDLNMKQVRKCHKNINIPLIDSKEVEPGAEGCGFLGFYDWLGFVSCNCNMSGEPDDYLSTYTCPTPNQLETCSTYRIEGMLSTTTVKTVLYHLINHVKTCNNTPWSAITVHGFADSPVSWLLREHGFQMSGENLFTYVVFKNEDYWLYSAVDSADICP